jgi:hypothetical protein
MGRFSVLKTAFRFVQTLLFLGQLFDSAATPGFCGFVFFLQAGLLIPRRAQGLLAARALGAGLVMPRLRLAQGCGHHVTPRSSLSDLVFAAFKLKLRVVQVRFFHAARLLAAGNFDADVAITQGEQFTLELGFTGTQALVTLGHARLSLETFELLLDLHADVV